MKAEKAKWLPMCAHMRVLPHGCISGVFGWKSDALPTRVGGMPSFQVGFSSGPPGDEDLNSRDLLRKYSQGRQIRECGK